MEEEYYLIYINKIGEDHKGQFHYEFIFSTTIKDIDGNEWDVFPASGRPEPPHSNFINKVGKLEAKIKLDVIQDSDTFAMWDSVDGVIALAWENINAYDSYPEHRLSFRFGETNKSVMDKLYEQDLILNFKKQSHEQ